MLIGRLIESECPASLHSINDDAPFHVGMTVQRKLFRVASACADHHSLSNPAPPIEMISPQPPASLLLLVLLLLHADLSLSEVKHMAGQHMAGMAM